MNSKNENVRFTLDLPVKEHRKLKTWSAQTGISMRDIILKAMPLMEQNIECLLSSHIPNEETIQAIQDSINRKNVRKAKDVFEILKHTEEN